MSINIRRIPIGTDVEILGHTFHGIEEIKHAVEAYCRIEKDYRGIRDKWTTSPRQPVAGLHVCEIYEPYPCFDAADYASENRDYANFFFSTKPFTNNDLDHLAQNLPIRCNYRMVTEDMPAIATPAVYCDGDATTMYIALTQ